MRLFKKSRIKEKLDILIDRGKHDRIKINNIEASVHNALILLNHIRNQIKPSVKVSVETQEESEIMEVPAFANELEEEMELLNGFFEPKPNTSKIDYDIPLPPVKRTYRGRRAKRIHDTDFKQMTVGASFPSDDKNIASAGRNYAKRNNLDWKFETRSEGEKTRIWRVK